MKIRMYEYNIYIITNKREKNINVQKSTSNVTKMIIFRFIKEFNEMIKYF